MYKEFTVGDMIKALQKLDPSLPLYDVYEEEGIPQWFNLQKPTPRTKNLFVMKSEQEDTTVLRLTDDGDSEGIIVDRKKVVVLYPMQKDEIEL